MGCFNSWMMFRNTSVFLLAMLLSTWAWSAQDKTPPAVTGPIFREDLHPFGYPRKASHQHIADYTDLAFLSDDLVLVSINERLFDGRIEPLLSHRPASKLLLFDISEKTLAKSSESFIEKFTGSVRATHNGKFVVLSGSEIRLCSKNLECDPPVPIPGEGPIFVSPKGTRIMAGGNGQNEQQLLDGDSLKVLDHFAPGQWSMPGDTAVLATRGHQLYLLREGISDKLLRFPGAGWMRLNAQFLSDDTFAEYENDQTFVGVGLEGAILYRISILPEGGARTNLVPAASGSRFCIHQSAYRVRGSKLSVSDKLRTRDVDIYRIFDTRSGEELFHFEWDPRPYVSTLVAPALAPNGHRIAVIRSGYLEVFELP
jgi:hypothetical protein